MPTVMTIGNVRVVIYTNDHPPPHVHALGSDARAKFHLNCPDGPVELVEHEGFKSREIRDIGAHIARNLSLACVKWSEIDG